MDGPCWYIVGICYNFGDYYKHPHHCCLLHFIIFISILTTLLSFLFFSSRDDDPTVKWITYL